MKLAPNRVIDRCYLIIIILMLLNEIVLPKGICHDIYDTENMQSNLTFKALYLFYRLMCAFGDT